MEGEDKKRGTEGNLRGIARLVSEWKSGNPDGGEPDTDELIESLWGDRENIRNSHNELLSKSDELKNAVLKDPRLGALLSGLADGEPFEYLFSKIYGKDILDMDAETIKKGHEEYASNEAKRREMENLRASNFEKLPQWASAAKDKYGWSDDEAKSVDDFLAKFESKASMYDYDDDVAAAITKMIRYDGDVESAKKAGMTFAQNKRIEELRKPAEELPNPKSVSGGDSSKRVVPEEARPDFRKRFKPV